LLCRFGQVIVMAAALLAATAAQADETGLTEAFMNDPANVELGQELFVQQCAKCHGKGAYPGKAPKLNARKLTPEDIYLRVTYGFRRMPAWEHVFSDEERMAITAYMKSPHFSN
jgi:mono/diheme cytochrome c family protein